MNKNQELHELLGLEWIEDWVLTNSEGTTVRIPREDNPDYATDPRLVLREMEKQGMLKEFLVDIWDERIIAHDTNLATALGVMVNIIYLILDTTGKLRNLAIDWLNK